MMEFNFQDAFPSLPLADIYPLSARAQSWLARASKRSDFLDKPSTQIAGAIYMLCGLDYHHRQFMSHIEQLSPYYARKKEFLEHICELPNDSSVSPQNIFPTEIERDHLDALHHVAVAYINRLGQFISFAKAMKLEAMCTRAKELISFRNKHTAHRSIDDPRNETFELQEMHAMAFNFYQLNNGAFPIFQIYDQGHHINFHMRDDHAVLMDEAMAMLQSLYAVPTDTVNT
ncbi:MAG: hypothetical protein WC069_06505 [Candidatus Shapirobacteria bacterium]|jgi:hypothetical protein